MIASDVEEEWVDSGYDSATDGEQKSPRSNKQAASQSEALRLLQLLQMQIQRPDSALNAADLRLQTESLRKQLQEAMMDKAKLEKEAQEAAAAKAQLEKDMETLRTQTRLEKSKLESENELLRAQLEADKATRQEGHLANTRAAGPASAEKKTQSDVKTAEKVEKLKERIIVLKSDLASEKQLRLKWSASSASWQQEAEALAGCTSRCFSYGAPYRREYSDSLHHLSSRC